MFLSPIFASIPPYATGPALILVGALMMVSRPGCNSALTKFLVVIHVVAPCTQDPPQYTVTGVTSEVYHPSLRTEVLLAQVHLP
jgi:hypothetical protein